MMSNKYIILCDMDDVIVDLSNGWRQFYNDKYNDSLTEEQFRITWDVHNNVKCGVDIYKILSISGFGRSLSPIRGAIDGFRYLSEKYNTYILTSASKSGQFCKEKYLWLERYMPFFDFKKLIICHDKWIVNGHLMIDDRYKNINKWNFHGRNGILVNAIHNEDICLPDNISRCYDWNQIIERADYYAGKAS